MTESTPNWTFAQQRERRYYETRAEAHPESEQVYAEFHAPFWRGILQRLHELTFRPEGYYLDVGCGPNPIVTFVSPGRRVGVDPLMPFYQQNFVLPPEFEAHEGTIEQLAPVPDGAADVIFSMNNIDHIKDLSVAVKTLRRKLKDDGYLVVSVNVVRSPLARTAARLGDIYRIVDPTHTYHFHSPEEVAEQLSSEFEMVRYENIDTLAQEMEVLKRQRDTTAMSVKGAVRHALKFVKNDVLLREELFLFVFKPRLSAPPRAT